MTYAPGYGVTMNPMVSPFQPMYSPFANEASSGGGNPSTATWESANRIVYMGVFIPRVCVIRRVWWANGGTVSGTHTTRVGIYRDTGQMLPGDKLVEGSATQATASVIQFVDVTDTAIAPGLWWIALTNSDGTANSSFMRSLLGSTAMDAGLRVEEAGSGTLPSTATPVKSTNAVLYVCGFSTEAS